MKRNAHKRQVLLVGLIVLLPALLYASFVIGKPIIDSRREEHKAREAFGGIEKALVLPQPESYRSTAPHTEYGVPLMAGAHWKTQEPGRVTAHYTLPEVTADTVRSHGDILRDAGWKEAEQNGTRKSQSPDDILQEERDHKKKKVLDLKQSGVSEFCLAHEYCQATNRALVDDAQNQPLTVRISYSKEKYDLFIEYSFQDKGQRTSHANVGIVINLQYR